ncbi:unnamed protein product [Lactuca saligna]|uniref:Protein kinase domain-containing protein n=1 Tax=Lactuca saligna TaxID=75948 RepID=A0AA35VPE0_LACSI|nr:unnamed protein product [Lactuca saligna]
MAFGRLFLIFSLLLIFPLISIKAQQPYIKKLNTNCRVRNASTSVLGYACNGVNRTCEAYLTFRSRPPYNTVTSISNLLNANATQLSQLNSVSETAAFGTGETVLVPTRCSCLGQFYQANATYVIQAGDTPFTIANNTFEGLSTCHAVQVERSNLTIDIYPGSRLTVPLRCACPTEKQAADGIRYLLSYLITWGQSVSSISAIFRVDTGVTLAANQLSEQDFTIYPFTTLLVPLSDQPSRSQTIAPPPPPTTSPPPSSPPPPTSSGDNKWIYMLVGVLGGVALTSSIGFAVFWFCFLRKRKQIPPPMVSSASQSFEAIVKPGDKKLDVDEDSDFMESLNSIAQSLKVYKFEELKSATQDFSPNCLIKGSVYKGTINGDLAAIKKMHGDVSKEIQLLNTIHHHNLIRLSGVCFNDSHWYLVFEFAVNGPLSDWIYQDEHEQTTNKSLNWIQRIQIALDVANALDYLHSYTTPPYVYKNLESSNILLDDEFRAKIIDFDLARSAEGQDGHFALTRHIVGTRGYMSPEYLENGLVSTKLDVYGLGVLMLEIVTGKHVYELYENVKKNLSEVLDDVLEEEDTDENQKLTDFVDPFLQGDYPPQLAMSVIRLIDGCLDKDPSARPDMNEVSQSLSRVLTTSHAVDVSVTISVQGR